MFQPWVMVQQASSTKEAAGNANALLRKRSTLSGPVKQEMPSNSTSRTKKLRLELVPKSMDLQL